MYTMILLASVGQGCNGGQFQGAPQFYFQPPPIVIYSGYQAPFAPSSYSSPWAPPSSYSSPWAPPSSYSSPWAPPSSGFHRGINVRVFDRPVFGIEGYRAPATGPQFRRD